MESVIIELENFSKKLDSLIAIFDENGKEFGNERYLSWKRSFEKFLEEYLPSEVKIFQSKLPVLAYLIKRNDQSGTEFFFEYFYLPIDSYLKSLILDLVNKEYFPPLTQPKTKSKTLRPMNKVFIVHGRDETYKEKVARFINSLGLEPIILHEQTSRSRTIIEKIDHYSNDVDFAIVIYTADDLGNIKCEAEKHNLNLRARQNVIFEHGYLIAKIGRENVIPLVLSEGLELPNDMSGIVYLINQDWKLSIAKEMKEAGYNVDFNKIM